MIIANFSESIWEMIFLFTKQCTGIFIPDITIWQSSCVFPKSIILQFLPSFISPTPNTITNTTGKWMDDESRKYFLDVKKEKYFYTMTRPVTSTSKHTKIEKHPLSFICYPFLLLAFPLFAEWLLLYQIYIVNNYLNAKWMVKLSKHLGIICFDQYWYISSVFIERKM